ncbi:MAG: sensor histidine kinase [Candidatus Hermodarchaeota archaeon]
MMIQKLALIDLIEGTVNSIAIIIFAIGIIISFLIYRRKKTITNLIQIIMFIVGFFYSLGEVLEAFTTWDKADEFCEFFFIFLSTIVFVVSATAYFEHKLRKSEHNLEILNKNLEQKIEERTKELKDINQKREDFVRSISHELKTPLISLYSSSQYLLDSYEDLTKSEIFKNIKIIKRGGNRLKILTENLLTVYDIESKRYDLLKQKENLTELVKDCINDMELLLKERDLFLKLDINNNYIINLDKNKIEQVILNLLSNAIKNTPPQGFIYVGLKRNNDYIDLIIKDTGIGFTKSEKQIAFKKFGKVDRKVEGKDIIMEGSGLGLYICQEIVKLHKGNIWLESEGRNKGSTFIIRLPISEKYNCL